MLSIILSEGVLGLNFHTREGRGTERQNFGGKEK